MAVSSFIVVIEYFEFIGCRSLLIVCLKVLMFFNREVQIIYFCLIDFIFLYIFGQCCSCYWHNFVGSTM